MIHESKLFEVVQTLKTFSIKWVGSGGELIEVDRCQSTSFHSSGETMNIRILESGQYRKVNRKTVTSINGQEVYI